MGLFHKTLGDIRKEVAHGNFGLALQFLEQHSQKEKALMEDLTGLQGAIESYRKSLEKINNSILARKELDSQTLSGTRRISPVDLKLMKGRYSKIINDQLINAQKEITVIEAILAKLWKKDRREIR